jgi:tetratricopeptide (TPR) repeat protein
MPDLILQYFWPIVISLCAGCVIWSIVRSQRDEKREEEAPGFEKKQQLVARLFFDAKYNSAFRELREMLPVQEKLLGPDDEGTLFTRMALGAVLMAKGHYRDAKDEFARVLEVRSRTLGETHGEVLIALINYSSARVACGEHFEAERLVLHALPGFEAAHGVCIPHVLVFREVLGMALAGQHRYAQALAELEASFSQFEQLPVEDTDSLRWDLRLNIALMKVQLERYAEAEAEARTLIRRLQGAEGHEQRRVMNLNVILAQALAGQGRFDDAEPIFRTIIRERERLLGSSHPDTLYALHFLAKCLQKAGRIEEARTLAERALEGRKEALGDQHPETRESAELVKMLV